MKKFTSLLLAAAFLFTGYNPANAQLLQYTGGGASKVELESASDISIDNKVLQIGLKKKTVSLTAADINGMYAAPVELVAAPGAGKALVVHKVLFRITRSSTAFANGGAVVAQYNTGNVAATNTIADTVVTGAAGVVNAVRNGIDVAAVQNDSLELTNATGAFDTGTGTAEVTVWYSVE